MSRRQWQTSTYTSIAVIPRSFSHIYISTTAKTSKLSINCSIKRARSQPKMQVSQHQPRKSNVFIQLSKWLDLTLTSLIEPVMCRQKADTVCMEFPAKMANPRFEIPAVLKVLVVIASAAQSLRGSPWAISNSPPPWETKWCWNDYSTSEQSSYITQFWSIWFNQQSTKNL